jgi:hypothetical protein
MYQRNTACFPVLFYPEYGSSMFLWNVKTHLPKLHSITAQETGSCMVSAVRSSSLVVIVTEGRKWPMLRPQGEVLWMLDVMVFDAPFFAFYFSTLNPYGLSQPAQNVCH